MTTSDADTRTMVRWLHDLSDIKDPTPYQLVEAWQLAQTINAIHWPDDQSELDAARRAIIKHLSELERPEDVIHKHIISVSSRRLKSWLEVELTPELSLDLNLAGRSIPSKLVKRLRIALGRQHTNLKELLRRIG